MPAFTRSNPVVIIDEALSAMHGQLEFLKIWHRVFAQNLEYVIDSLQEAPDLSVDAVASDSTCKTGQWLAAQVAEIRELAEFDALCEVHRQFHLIASDVLRAFQAGHFDQARRMSDADFRSVALGVEQAIDRLGQVLGSRGVATNRFTEADWVKADSVWNESLATGIPDIDRRHHAIAMLIDQLVQRGHLAAASDEAQGFLGSLERLLKRDAESENAYLEQEAPDLASSAAHIADHARIFDYLEQMRTAVTQGRPVTLGEIGAYLGDWYIEHLVSFDIDFARLRSDRPSVM